jgi:hypothetical protein
MADVGAARGLGNAGAAPVRRASPDGTPLSATGLASDLRLPPLFRLVGLREHGDAHAHAVRIAAEAGAGTLVRVRRFEGMELALVLEPAEELAGARRALMAVMLAVADALTVAAPPERPVGFAWPATILVDGATVGRCRLAWPDHTPEHEVPAWLVVSCQLRLQRLRGPEPGRAPEMTSLRDEGFEELDADALLCSFASHLMRQLHDWEAMGFRPLAERWLGLLGADAGRRRRLSPAGDLLIEAIGGDRGRMERRPLVPALAEADRLGEARP